MWKIIKKQLNSFLINLVVFIIISAVILGVTEGDIQKILFVTFICGIFVFFVVLGPVFSREQYEEKNKGYVFLDILPISSRDIVTAKFLLVLAVEAVYVGSVLIFLSFSPAMAKTVPVARSLVLICGSLCLILVAFSYIMIFWIGYTKYLVVVLSFTVLLGLGPPLIIMFARDKVDVYFQNIGNLIASLNWIILGIFILCVYFALMFVAVKIKRDI